MTDWMALAKARALDIPEDALKQIAPSLDSLEKAFQPLLAKLQFSGEPTLILSERSVLGADQGRAK